MGFQLVPKSMSLNDLERRNSHYFALFRRIAFAASYVKVVDYPSTDFLQRNVFRYTHYKHAYTDALCSSR